MIHVDRDGGTATVRIAHGKANALDLELMADLGRALEAARAGGASAVVLTGSGSIFGAGVDLYRVIQGGHAYAEAFVPALARFFLELFEYPLPMVAAINGHAIAGGCVAACACDYRIMADGKGTIGIPELLVGVPFPAAALEIMRLAVPPQELQALVYTGRTCRPDEALRRGLVHEVVGAGELLDRAAQVTAQLGSIPRHVFAATKGALRAAAVERLRGDRTLPEVTRFWASDATRTHIQDYLDRVVRRAREEGR